MRACEVKEAQLNRAHAGRIAFLGASARRGAARGASLSLPLNRRWPHTLYSTTLYSPVSPPVALTPMAPWRPGTQGGGDFGASRSFMGSRGSTRPASRASTSHGISRQQLRMLDPWGPASDELFPKPDPWAPPRTAPPRIMQPAPPAVERGHSRGGGGGGRRGSSNSARRREGGGDRSRDRGGAAGGGGEQQLADVLDDDHWDNDVVTSVFTTRWRLCDGTFYEPTEEALRESGKRQKRSAHARTHPRAPRSPRAPPTRTHEAPCSSPGAHSARFCAPRAAHHSRAPLPPSRRVPRSRQAARRALGRGPRPTSRL